MFKVVLIGSGDLAYGLLQGLLHSDHLLVGILAWDTPVKHHLRTWIKYQFVDDFNSPPNRHKLHRLRPCRANSTEFARQIKEIDPDILLVAGWGEILKPSTIALPNIACINVHPSLLPRHRGANPVSSVLRAGETETGITFHLMNEKVDAGDILLQSSIGISDNDNGGSLSRKLSYRAKEMVNPLLNQIHSNGINPSVQDASKSCYRPRLSPNDAYINWNTSAADIHNQVRGSYPWLLSETHHGETKLMVTHTRIADLYQPTNTPGEVLYKLGAKILVASSDPLRAIWIDEVRLSQSPSIGRLKAKLYINKFVSVGDILK